MRLDKKAIGSYRDKEGFLWLPKGKVEIRWLEHAKWAERYIYVGFFELWVFEYWITE